MTSHARKGQRHDPNMLRAKYLEKRLEMLLKASPTIDGLITTQSAADWLS